LISRVLKAFADAEVVLQVPSNSSEYRLLRTLTVPPVGSLVPSELAELLQVANVELGQVPAKAAFSAEVQLGKNSVVLQVRKTQAQKCPRCWRFSKVGNKEGVCARCADVISRK
jgi:hypothetical protein